LFAEDEICEEPRLEGTLGARFHSGGGLGGGFVLKSIFVRSLSTLLGIYELNGVANSFLLVYFVERNSHGSPYLNTPRMYPTTSY
jgi:hypothetical protein